MPCSHPPQLSEDQLTAALDGRGDDEVLAHLRSCPFCQQRKKDAQRVEAWMRTTLLRADCPSPSALRDYDAGLLGVDAQQAVAIHLAQCVSCQQEMAILTSYLADDLPALSDSRTPVHDATPPGNSLVEMLASIFTPSPLAAPALRGNSSGPLVAKAGDTTLFLDFQTAAIGYRVLGQIVSDDPDIWPDALVEVRQQEEELSLSIVDDTGAFEVGLDKGEPFELRIIARNQTIIVLRGIEPPAG